MARRIGQLDHKINFRKEFITVDSNGDKVSTTSTIKNDVWCSIKFVGTPSAGASEERIDDEQVTGKIKIEATCRYFPGVSFQSYFVYENTIFDIYSILVLGKKEWLQVRGQMRDDQSSMFS